jgi:hypothetical protein
MNSWSLTGVFNDAPEKAEELRIDKCGNFYWSAKHKISWTKGVVNGNYSAALSDKIIATKNPKKEK